MVISDRKDSDEVLGKGMEDLKDRDLSILITDPPTEADRLSELPLVSDQYRNPKNPKNMFRPLDLHMDDMFNAILLDKGLVSSLYMIVGISKSIVPDIQFHKEYFGISRPKQLADRHGIEFDCYDIESAKTYSYPSGHTAQAYYLAKVLGEIYPEAASELLKLAANVADSRVDMGVHFPSDIQGGKDLADALFDRNTKKVMTGDLRYQEIFGV